MPAYDNTAVAAKLELTADLLEITGADKFRFLSYRKAASSVRALAEQVAALGNAGRLTEIPGVGAKMAVNIEQIIERGSFDALDEVRARIPATLAEVMKIPGVGPKRAAQLHERLGVATVADLARALDEGKVASLGGFGPKSASSIAAGIASYARHHERTPIGTALPVAEQLAAELAALAPVGTRIEIAGDLRRREESVSEIELLAGVAAPGIAPLLAAFESLPAVERVLDRDATSASVELHDGLQVVLHIAAPDALGVALQELTGSEAHLAQVRERAHAQGVAITDGGVFRLDAAGDPIERLGGADEADVYSALGLRTPAPELRQGSDELDLAAAGALPELVTLADVRGDLQSHSTGTDGRNTLAENRSACAALGYEYFAATDHALNLRMVGGLEVAQLEAQWAEIDQLNATAGPGQPRILKGIELNIADDGSVDYDGEVLARFDIVLASLHSGWDQDEATATKRLIAAIENPWVDVIAHCTGRVIGRRDPIRLDMEAVLAAAGETGTIMEINSYPDRLDLSAENIQLARRYGVRFSLGTDAHAAEHFGYMRYGVAQARRGRVTPQELINAQPWEVRARGSSERACSGRRARERARPAPTHPPFGAELPRAFFERSPDVVAPLLLGCIVATHVDGVSTAGVVVETEAYLGRDDAGSHASTKGITARNATMYGPPGTAYVYFTYGNHHMLNLVCEPDGIAGAVLIRALRPLVGIDTMTSRRRGRSLAELCNGPGKLAAALGVDLFDNGSTLGEGRISVYYGDSPATPVAVSGRVGLTRGHELPLRFYLQDDPYVSRGLTGPLSPKRRRANREKRGTE